MIILILSLQLCSTETIQQNEQNNNNLVLLNNPAKSLSNYNFDPKSKLISRVDKMPDFYLGYLRKAFNNNNLTPYIPTTIELSIFEESLDLLPPLHRKILNERLISIYFVDNYKSSGTTDWVLDEKGDIHFVYVLNARLFLHSISEWLTHRENSCFNNDELSIDIKIDCGEKYLAIDYIMLHESTHAVDYIKNFTPYVSHSLQEIRQEKIKDTPFIEGVWEDYFTPISKYDYPYREKTAFYGINPKTLKENTSKISNKKSIELYKQLSSTPFVSIYASLSWVEDFADFVSLYHLTKNLGQPYVIRVIKGNTQIYSYEPMKSNYVRERIPDITSIYLIPD